MLHGKMKDYRSPWARPYNQSKRRSRTWASEYTAVAAITIIALALAVWRG